MVAVIRGGIKVLKKVRHLSDWSFVSVGLNAAREKLCFVDCIVWPGSILRIWDRRFVSVLESFSSRNSFMKSGILQSLDSTDTFCR